MPRLQLGAKISARTEEGVNARSTARRFPLSRHWFGASSNDKIMLRRVGLRRRDTGLAPRATMKSCSGAWVCVVATLVWRQALGPGSADVHARLSNPAIAMIPS